jgi:hypothetical protein
MTRPDFVTFVLGALDTQANGGNWNTDNADHPIRYNRRDGIRLDTGAHTPEVSAAEDAIASVALTGVSRTPIGTEFDYRFEATLSARLEGVHVDERGTVDPDSETASWPALSNEFERALDTERRFPTDDREVLSQTVELDNDLSRNLSDHYRADWTVTIDGFEDAP